MAEMDFEIEWHEDFAKIKNGPATKDEMSKMMSIIKKQALITKPGEVIEIYGRMEVIETVASGINITKSGYAVVNPHDDPKFDGKLGYFMSRMLIARDRIAMREYLNG